MIFKAFAEFDATIGGGLHQMNPAAGRFGFQPQHPVSRTLIQTQSAVDTLIEFGQVQASRFLDDRWALLCGQGDPMAVIFQFRVFDLESRVLNPRPETRDSKPAVFKSTTPPEYSLVAGASPHN